MKQKKCPKFWLMNIQIQHLDLKQVLQYELWQSKSVVCIM